ncbi:hypothetical protein Q4485_05665 [Granulosicoccaceae sp. 1_MG-2023]|nr:hypothetical protein [Granulosicoccaceae sp. 1_MG-2023]
MKFSPLIPALLALALSACATPDKRDTRYEPGLQSYTDSDGGIRHEVRDETVAELWRKADLEMRKGQQENALKYINMAIETTPEDPVLWSRGAELYLSVRENGLAENYATKSNSFANRDSRTLMYRNWLIIKHAREMRGDLLGARDAQENVLRYRP